MAKNVVGAQLYTLRDYAKTLDDVRATLKKVADIGYTAAQISGFGPMKARDVARAFADTGLTVAATHVGWDDCLEDLDRVIDEHQLWKCSHLAIGGLPPHYYTLDGLKRFLDELAPVAEALAAEGIDFSYHNHSHELQRFGKTTWLAMLYDQAPPEHLKAEIDTYWIQHGGGDPVAWIRQCAGREPLLHLKDMARGPEGQQFAEVGEGNLNWPGILEAAAESGVEWYLVEQDDCYERDPFEALAISYRNLKEMGLS